MQVFFTRELVARLSSSTGVIINLVNPGLCTSNLERNSDKAPVVLRLVRRILDRTTEVGSRTFVLGAERWGEPGCGSAGLYRGRTAGTEEGV